MSYSKCNGIVKCLLSKISCFGIINCKKAKLVFGWKNAVGIGQMY